MPSETRTPVGPRDWKKIVAESAGLQRFIPSELTADAKAWQEKRLAFMKKVNEISKMENDVSLTFTTLIYKIREAFEAAGVDGAWSMDVGFEMNALKDGEYIINITPNQK
jgi:hypothetical protein